MEFFKVIVTRHPFPTLEMFYEFPDREGIAAIVHRWSLMCGVQGVKMEKINQRDYILGTRGRI